MRMMKQVLAALAIVPVLLLAPTLAAASGPEVPLDRAPIDLNDNASLQRGAKLFANYCLNCHSASMVRYNRMQDIGLTEEQIKDNLLFAGDKPGELMKVGMQKADAKAWFGANPPDLSVIARSRSPDWLYSYLRGFYLDPSRPTGWNNTVFEKVGMPHVMWDLQGMREARFKTDEHGHQVLDRLELVKPGSVTPAQYDAMVGDLVNFLTWMGEPVQVERKQLGVIVLLFLGFFFIIAYYLKKEFWKDIH